MTNIRIRSAVLAIFFGNIGLDMLMLRRQQVMLFLFMGGLCWVPIALGIVGIAASETSAWVFLTAGGVLFLEFWSLARFFEYLNLTDEEFAQRLEGAY